MRHHGHGRNKKDLLALEDAREKVLNGNDNPDDTLITRVQIQRMMNDNAKLGEVLGTNRAIDVIRQFRIEKEPDPYDVVTRLQRNVIAKLHELEDANLKLTFGEIESLKMVSQGLQ